MSEGLRSFPKVELHRHLDGSVRFETIRDLAKKHRLNLGVKNDHELLKKTKITSPMKNLEEVLNCFWTHQKVLVNYEAIKRVTFENIEDAFRDNVTLLELRFSPAFISEGKKLENDEIIEGVLDGLTEAMTKYPVQVGLLHIVARTLDPQKNLAATHDIIRYQKSQHKNADRLLGLDLADLETTHPPEAFLEHVKLFRERSLGVTVHTAENTDGSFAQKNIEVLSPDRLGHGIQIIHHPEALKLVKDKNIHLEVCPTSNYLTQCVKTLAEHPFKKLYDQGVSLSLNSDDPQLMNIDLTHEYEVVRQHFNLGAKDFLKINKMALEHSFLPRELKQRILKQHFSFK